MKLVLKISKKKNKVVWIGVLLFYLIFMPDFSGIIPVLKNSLIVVLLTGVYIFRNIVRYFQSNSRKKISKSNREVINFIIVITCVSFYTFLLTILLKHNISSNLPGIFVPMKLILLYSLMYELILLGYDEKKLIDLLILITNIQAMICILMLLVPQLKGIANSLYISNIDNYASSGLAGITIDRIYGIFGDYTYSGPIYMAMMASVCLLLFFKDRQVKYLLFSILQLLASVLNGRTGALIYVVVAIVIVISNMKMKISKFTFVGVALFLFVAILGGLGIWTNDRLGIWFQEAIEVILSILLEGEETSLGRMWFFPEGINFVLGEGHRVFGGYGIEAIGKASDIGYVNEFYRGGLLFFLVFHISNLKIMFSTGNKYDTQYSNIMGFCLLIYILFGNYKGELTSASTAMLGIWYIVFASKMKKNNDERSISINYYSNI